MFSLYLQSIFLIFSIVAGFLIAIPIGISKSNYNGSCLLYASFTEDPIQRLLQPGSALTCNFCIFSGAISLSTALVLLLGTLCLIWRKHCGNFSISSELDKWERQTNSPRYVGCILLCVQFY